MAKFIVHLIGGQSVSCHADDSEIDTIYDNWHDEADLIHFENGSFRVSMVAGLEYVNEKE